MDPLAATYYLPPPAIIPPPPAMEWARHGYPPGYRFVPKDCELAEILAVKVNGGKLELPSSIFHDIDVLGHPEQLYDGYKEYMEKDSIYFFSERKFSNPNGKRQRPIRAVEGGSWKASGGAKPIFKNGKEIGKCCTLVFYENRIDEETGMINKKADVMTKFAVQEVMIYIKPRKVADLALYRLYIKKNAQSGTKDADVDDEDQFSPPPHPEIAPGWEDQPDDSSEQENEPSVVNDDIFQFHSQPGMAQPHYDYGFMQTLEAAYPSYLGYMNDGYDDFAYTELLEIVQSAPLLAALEYPVMPPPQMMTQEPLDQLLGSDHIAWSLDHQLLHCGIGPGFKAEPRVIEGGHTGAGFEDGSAPAEPNVIQDRDIGGDSEMNVVMSDDGAEGDKNLSCTTGFIDRGGEGAEGDENLSCTQGFTGHGGDGESAVPTAD